LYDTVDWLLNIFFTFEMVIKVVGLGRVYLAEKWNILDGTIVVGSWAALIVEVVMGNQFAGAVTNLRILRVLRPLRVLESIPGLRIIINSTLYAVRDVGVLLAIGLPSECHLTAI
jgi:Ion transport protein